MQCLKLDSSYVELRLIMKEIHATENAVAATKTIPGSDCKFAAIVRQ